MPRFGACSTGSRGPTCFTWIGRKALPGLRYRHLWADAEDIDGNGLRIVTYIADGKEQDGNPSLRYIALLREGARAHSLPEAYLRFLDSVKNAE